MKSLRKRRYHTRETLKEYQSHYIENLSNYPAMPNAVSTNSKPYDSLKGNDIVNIQVENFRTRKQRSIEMTRQDWENDDGLVAFLQSEGILEDSGKEITIDRTEKSMEIQISDNDSGDMILHLHRMT